MFLQFWVPPTLAAFSFQIKVFSFYSGSHEWDWMTSRGRVIKWSPHLIQFSFLHSLPQCYCFANSSSFLICMYYSYYLISHITSFSLISIKDMSKQHSRLMSQSSYREKHHFLFFLLINCTGHVLPNEQKPLLLMNLWSILSSSFIICQNSSSLLA